MSEEVACEHMHKTMEEFFEFIKEPRNKIQHADHKYLKDAMEVWTGIATFYCLPKVHKKLFPVPLRPVIAQVGTCLYALGKWIVKVLKPSFK